MFSFFLDFDKTVCCRSLNLSNDLANEIVDYIQGIECVLTDYDIKLVAGA